MNSFYAYKLEYMHTNQHDTSEMHSFTAFVDILAKELISHSEDRNLRPREDQIEVPLTVSQKIKKQFKNSKNINFYL